MTSDIYFPWKIVLVAILLHFKLHFTNYITFVTECLVNDESHCNFHIGTSNSKAPNTETEIITHYKNSTESQERLHQETFRDIGMVPDH